MIGGTSAEFTLKTVKLASTHYLDDLPTTGTYVLHLRHCALFSSLDISIMSVDQHVYDEYLKYGPMVVALITMCEFHLMISNCLHHFHHFYRFIVNSFKSADYGMTWSGIAHRCNV